MKRRFIASLMFLVSIFMWNTSRAYCDPLANYNEMLNEHSEELCEDLTEPYIDIRICFNAFFVQVCFTLRCDLHWSDIIQPGLGQLMGHEGCQVLGQAQGPGGQNIVQFDGNSEDMIRAIETSTNVPKGSLQNVQVTQSPTFSLPDGKEYRVVAKTYPVLNGPNGRYLPFEVETVKK